MARKHRSASSIAKQWYNTYRKALNWYRKYTETKYELPELEHPNKKSVNKAKKLWKELKKKIGKEQPERTVTVRQGAKWYDEQEDWKANHEPERDEDYRTYETPTIDYDHDYIEQFKETAKMIYDNTLNFIASNTARTSTHDDKEAKLASIGSQHTGDIASSYYELIATVDRMVGEYGEKLTADMIASDTELDYDLAIGLGIEVPSDLTMNFEITTQNLASAMQRIDTEAEQRAIEAEGEYWGG